MPRLTKAEIEFIQHALYMHREYCRTEERLHRERRSSLAEGASYSINFSLKLDSKLSDMKEDRK